MIFSGKRVHGGSYGTATGLADPGPAKGSIGAARMVVAGRVDSQHRLVLAR